MKFKLSNCKSDTSYITLLSNITFKYVNDYWNGETFYAEYSLDNEKGNLVELFINELTLIPIIINKKNTIILNLLVNPLFNELCDYLSSKPKISKSKIRLIKKYIFSYLGS